MMDFIFLYGPPGSGKTSTGRALAERLGIPFHDLDKTVESNAGKTIPEIFSTEGEAAFRGREHRMLAVLVNDIPSVIALGGGSLLNPETRRLAETSGQVLLLTALRDILEKRLSASLHARPLLAGDLHDRLETLLSRRFSHYASFPLALDTSSLSSAEVAWQAQICLGRFRVRGMGQPYDVLIEPGGLASLGWRLRTRGLKGPLALVSDSNVAALYASRVTDSLVESGYSVHQIVIPPGEAHKTIETVQRLWQGFLEGGVERSSTVLALGGGVTGDLTGFAAATYQRGVRWINLPTTLLAMADASLGGKTGADLPQGKNLVGAFHPPTLVLSDPHVLATLPPAELRSGLAEVLKQGVINDPILFDLASRPQVERDPGRLAEIVRRSMAVKIQVIEEDPYEKDRRAVLNLGHTIGHALEMVSNFQLRHGEAIAIGMLLEARLAEQSGLAQPGLAACIQTALQQVGLPTSIPDGLDRQAILDAMRLDKKRQDGVLRFALPKRVGEVVAGIEVSAQKVLEVL
jgi:3-dehydroquinate synthase